MPEKKLFLAGSIIGLIPLFFALALTSMRMVTFYWVSQLGMLPGTAAYINAGK